MLLCCWLLVWSSKQQERRRGKNSAGGSEINFCIAHLLAVTQDPVARTARVLNLAVELAMILFSTSFNSISATFHNIPTTFQQTFNRFQQSFNYIFLLTRQIVLLFVSLYCCILSYIAPPCHQRRKLRRRKLRRRKLLRSRSRQRSQSHRSGARVKQKSFSCLTLCRELLMNL